ncbi:MAG: glucosamine-6-phosphate deaminase [Acidobacteriota bacterium]
MLIRVFPDKAALSRAASADAAALLRAAISERGEARVVAATGTSQIAFLEHLCEEPGIAWDKVELFHLDEYLSLPADHPASFRRFLNDRLVSRVGIQRVHFLDGAADPLAVVCQTGAAISGGPIDVAFAGIGENAHLAFNDPPADFETEAPFLVVELDEACRRQQVSEGWFESIDDVPKRAITMSVRQILKAKTVLCLASGLRKATAVAASFGQGSVSPVVPASMLRQHAGTTVYLDPDAASGLTEADVRRWA